MVPPLGPLALYILDICRYPLNAHFVVVAFFPVILQLTQTNILYSYADFNLPTDMKQSRYASTPHREEKLHSKKDFLFFLNTSDGSERVLQII